MESLNVGPEDKKYWIALNLVPGIGSIVYRSLISVFKNPRQVFKAARKDLLVIEGVGPKTAEALRTFPIEKRLETELAQIEKYAVKVVTYRDSEYPKNLVNIYDPPPVLYVRGDLSPSDDLAVAIVGSRMASRYGQAFTEQLACDFGAQGITVVSGMARGIDSAAHRGALLGRGRTIAVLGSGLDVVYPPENRGLMQEIMLAGALISEFPMGTEPAAFNFPRRNRIISGLAMAVIIVQASSQSGSLITANYALEQGREVFAVPGNVGLPNSQGTNRLIKEGAKLIERAQDVIEEILPRWKGQKEANGETARSEPRPTLTEEEQVIYGLLGDEPTHIDNLISQTHWDAGCVSRVLLNMELAGLISQLPGKQFVRR